MRSAAANQLVYALLEGSYSYSSTQINAPDNIADLLIKWGRINIPDKNLYYEDDGGCGREDNIHVTCLYGLLAKKPPAELIKIVEKTPPFTIKLGKVSLFENEKNDVVKLEVESEGLVKLHEQIRSACDNECKHPKFTPHVTIAYVKCGTGADLVGKDPFEAAEEVDPEFEAQELVFSSKGDDDDAKRLKVSLPFAYWKRDWQEEAETPKQFIKRFHIRRCLQIGARVRIVKGEPGLNSCAGTIGTVLDIRHGRCCVVDDVWQGCIWVPLSDVELIDEGA
jgi:2'-5' RNA ligase